MCWSGPCRPRSLRRVVELPAGRVGLRVEPELADALVDDVEGEPGALPLLSTALLELWQKRQDDALTLAAYRESGGVHGAVARLAEGTYARVPDERKQLVRAIMLRLVGEGEGDAPVRRRAPLAELDLERNADVADVLATLADSRLVTVSEGNVEVAHEALLREWPRLREWIEEDAEGRRLRRHITQAATEWDAAGRDQGELYRGARLAAALDWTADHALDVNELERAFVTESREVSEKETQARQAHQPAPARPARRASRSCSAPPSRAGSSPSSSAVRRATRRRHSSPSASARRRSSRRTSTSRSCSPARRSRSTTRRRPAATCSPHSGAAQLPSGSCTVTAKCSEDSPSVPTGRRWRCCLRRRSPLLRCPDLRADRGPAGGVVRTRGASRTAPTGETLAVGGDQHPFASSTRERVRSWPRQARRRSRHANGVHEGRVAARRPRRAGVRHGLGDGDAQITIRDAATLEPIGRSIEPKAFVGAYVGFWYASPQFALTPDDRFLITASEDGELAWWDLESRKKTRTLRIETGTAPALAVSPDGLTAAVGIKHGVQLVDLRSRNRADGNERSRSEPELGAVQPGRQDARLDEPRQDGDSLGRRVG